MSKRDDDYFEEIDLDEEDPEEPDVPPDQFVREIYNIAAKRHQRGTTGIYPSDFLYDMIPSQSANGEIVWWMSQSHPIALMLIENDINSDGLYQEISSMKSALGHVIIYNDSMVKECRDCLVDLCRKFDLAILEEPIDLIVDQSPKETL